MSNDSQPHRTTLRVLKVLELLSACSEGMTFTELYTKMNVPKSSLFPVIRTMTNEGFVSFDEKTGLYAIGLKTFLAARAFDNKDNNIKLLTHIAKQIVDECDETCQIGILDQGRVLYVVRVNAPQPVVLASDIGMTLPIHCTATGKALVSELSYGELAVLMHEPFERKTNHTLTTVDELWEELKEVRATGFAYNKNETIEDITCIATPLKK